MLKFDEMHRSAVAEVIRDTFNPFSVNDRIDAHLNLQKQFSAFELVALLGRDNKSIVVFWSERMETAISFVYDWKNRRVY